MHHIIFLSTARLAIAVSKVVTFGYIGPVFERIIGVKSVEKAGEMKNGDEVRRLRAALLNSQPTH
jgi:hypothetical protein